MWKMCVFLLKIIGHLSWNEVPNGWLTVNKRPAQMQTLSHQSFEFDISFHLQRTFSVRHFILSKQCVCLREKFPWTFENFTIDSKQTGSRSKYFKRCISHDTKTKANRHSKMHENKQMRDTKLGTKNVCLNSSIHLRIAS